MFKVRKTRYHQDVASAIKMAFTGTIENTKEAAADIFETMPDSILLEIFKHFRFTSLGTLAQVCGRWRRVAMDELLWRNMFLKHYSLPPSTNMPPGAISWRMEFKRLYDEAPVVTADEDKVFVQPFFEDIIDNVGISQASFSNDGTKFALCAMQGHVSVWELANPSTPLLIKKNLDYIEYCEFNKSDTRLLVKANAHIMGEGCFAVLSIDKELEVQCTNLDYDLTNASEYTYKRNNVHWRKLDNVHV